MTADPYKYFRIEARELLDGLSQGVLALEKQQHDAELVARLLRLAHTLKGAARVVRRPEIAASAHRLEEEMAPLREPSAAPTRADVERLLAIVDLMVAEVAAIDEPAAAPPVATEAPRIVKVDNTQESDTVLEG